MENLISNIESGFSNQETIESKLFNVQLEQLTPTKPGFDIPQAFGVYKSTGGASLGVVGKNYVPTQPTALWAGMQDCGLDLSEAEFKTYKNDTRCYFTIPIEMLGFKNAKGKWDETNVWVVIQTGFDGNTATTCYLLTFRPFCDNQLKISNSEAVVKFKNTKGNQGKVLSLCDDIVRCAGTFSDLKEVYKTFDRTQINQKVVDNYLDKVFNIDVKIKDEWNTRKLNMYNDIMGAMDLEFGRTGATAFGLLQGTTYYTNHIATNSGSDDYLLAGTGSKTNDKAMKVLMEMV